MNLFTIGYTQKSAEEFFTSLLQNGVIKLIDIRLNNQSQLAGFANAKHLPYLLKIHNITYEYKMEFAPTKELLNGYQNKVIDWLEYEKQYNQILVNRDILKNMYLLWNLKMQFCCAVNQHFSIVPSTVGSRNILRNMSKT